MSARWSSSHLPRLVLHWRNGLFGLAKGIWRWTRNADFRSGDAHVQGSTLEPLDGALEVRAFKDVEQSRGQGHRHWQSYHPSQSDSNQHAPLQPLAPGDHRPGYA